jgi:hypothetical protein
LSIWIYGSDHTERKNAARDTGGEWRRRHNRRKFHHHASRYKLYNHDWSNFRRDASGNELCDRYKWQLCCYEYRGWYGIGHSV